MTVHRLAIGQSVRLKGRFGSTETFQIIATLPERGTAPQYRIRSDNEKHERVAQEDNLELLEAPAIQDGRSFPAHPWSLTGAGTAASHSAEPVPVRDVEAFEAVGWAAAGAETPGRPIKTPFGVK